MFNLDLSIFVILGMLVVLNWILTRLLYNPILENYHQRQSELNTMAEEADRNNQRTGALISKMEKQLDSARLDAELEEKQILQKCEEQAHEELHAKLVDSHECFVACRSMLSADEEEIAQDLQSSVAKMASMVKDSLLPLILLVSVSLIWNSDVTAASGGTSSEHHAVTIHADLERLFSFLVMSTILFIFLRKPIRKFFINRRINIKHSLKQTKIDLLNSREAVQEVAEQEVLITDKINHLFETARSRAKSVGEEVLQNSRNQIQKIQNQHDNECEFLRLQAFQKLKHRIVSDTVSHVYRDLETGIPRETDRKIVQHVIDQLDNFLDSPGDINEKFTH